MEFGRLKGAVGSDQLPVLSLISVGAAGWTMITELSLAYRAQNHRATENYYDNFPWPDRLPGQRGPPITTGVAEFPAITISSMKTRVNVAKITIRHGVQE